MASTSTKDSWNEWSGLLDELVIAQSRGQTAREFQLMQEILKRRAELRASFLVGPATDLDLQLLNTLAWRLRQTGLEEEALSIYEIVCAFCRELGDSYGEAYFETEAAECCIAVLDFESAAVLLNRRVPIAIERSACNANELLAAIQRLQYGDAEKKDLQELQWQLATAVSRYYSAIGWLGLADQLLSLVLKLPYAISRERIREIELFHAEIRLDRGDLEGFDVLYARAVDSLRPEQEGMLRRWQTLQAGAKILSGDYGGALELLSSVCSNTTPSLANPAGKQAWWQRIQLLATLNRLDEATELLADLRLSDSVLDTDVDRLSALISARRASGEKALDLPPSVRELIATRRAPASDLISNDTDTEGNTSIRELPGRSRERVRDEWVKLSHEIQLRLHCGQIQDAAVLFAALSDWTGLLESRLLTARCHYLEAIVAWKSGDVAHAWKAGTTAASEFKELGMRPDELNVCHLLVWMGEPTENQRVTRELQRRARDLIEEISGTLNSTDFVSWRLNKWTLEEEWLSSEIMRLREDAREVNGGSVRDRVRKAATLVSAMRGWALDENEDIPPPVLSHEGDVYTWVSQHLASRQAAPRQELAHGDIACSWLPRRAAVVVYCALPDRLEGFLLHRQGAVFVKFREQVSRTELHQRVKSVLNRLRFRRQWDANSPSLQSLASALGLEQIAAELPASVKELYIVPDNILHHVPFSALPINGEPLVERFAWGFVPDLTWIRRNAKSRPVASGGKNTTHQRSSECLVVGVPETEVGDFPVLEFANNEATKIARLLGAGALLNDQSNCESVSQALSFAQYCHIACHGEFRPEAPLESGLALRDRWLTIADIQKQTLDQLEFVFLGSCWSGNISVLPGGESIGMPTAFLKSGARSVITSLWAVLDRSNADFACRLYENMAESGVLRGLADTQQQWLGRSTNEWAGFTAQVAGITPSWQGRISFWIRQILKSLRRRLN